MNYTRLAAIALLPIVLPGQQDILGSRTIHGDLTVNGAVTLPVSRGTTLPATCTVGQLFFRTQTQIGIHECRVTNTWTYLGSGGGVTSLNALTGALSIARTNDTNVNMTVTPSGSTVSLDLSWTGALAKARQHASTAYTDQANTFSAARQSLTSSASDPGLRLIPYAGDPTTPLDGDIWYNSSTNKFRCRVNGATVDCDTGGGGGISITRTPVTHSATPTYTRTSAIQQFAQTLTSNVTGSTLLGAIAGDLLSFEFTQDSTPRTVAMPTGFPTLALCATSGSVTVAQYFWTGSAAVERSVNSPGCTERVIRWQDGTTTTFPAGSDTAATLGGTQTFSGNKSFTGRLNVPNSTTLPATCSVGDVYVDTDATSGQRVYVCETTNTWVVQGGGGGGGGTLLLSGNCVNNLQAGAGQYCGNAGFTTAAQPEVFRFPSTGNITGMYLQSRGYFGAATTCTLRFGSLTLTGTTYNWTGETTTALTASFTADRTYERIAATGGPIAVTAGQLATIFCVSSVGGGSGVGWSLYVE